MRRRGRRNRATAEKEEIEERRGKSSGEKDSAYSRGEGERRRKKRV